MFGRDTEGWRGVTAPTRKKMLRFLVKQSEKKASLERNKSTKLVYLFTESVVKTIVKTEHITCSGKDNNLASGRLNNRDFY